MRGQGPSPRAVAGPIAFVVLFAAASPARADSALDEAKALTSKATIEYDVGKFQQALELYSKAYERYPTPALLFNIGQCHKLLKNYEREIFFFRGYLRAQRSAPNRSSVQALITEAQRELDDERALEAAKAEAALPATTEAATGAVPSGSAGSSPAGAGPTGAPGPPTPTRRIVGLGVAGAGLVTIGLGAYFGLHAASLSSEISTLSSNHGTWTAQYQSDDGSGKSSATIASALYVTGGVLVAAGAVLTYLGWPKGTGVTAAIAPGSGGAQIGVVGRF